MHAIFNVLVFAAVNQWYLHAKTDQLFINAVAYSLGVLIYTLIARRFSNEG